MEALPSVILLLICSLLLIAHFGEIKNSHKGS